MDKAKHENALIHETSPYLLQHAHNPVHWYPWGTEALERAQKEDKPIMLSIGYSACHWCHVMAHESFEDEATAAVMNEHFINIKVDREERPDLDRIYQTAQQLLTQRTGGWPLTMFLTPDQLPFFGGTYFPPASRYGLPGFRDLLLRVTEYYRKAQEDIRKQNLSMQEALLHIGSLPPPDAGLQLNNEPLPVAVQQLAESFDQKHGGFGGAPKFPHPSSLERLLRDHLAHQKENETTGHSLHLLEHTLRNMAGGGIYDQLGGGFSRYSVDERWMIPHFEKMLYDNGPLLTLYTQAWQITHNPLYKTIALETAAWVMREMQAPDGGYYSSLDADSEGHEGKFYVWNREEIRALLDADEFAVAERYFGLDQPANFEGHWHLYVAAPLAPATERTVGLLRNARHKLLAVRNERIWPGRDEKILTSWNALMIKGLATATAVFEDASCFDSAARALEFIRTTLWRNGRLLATCKGGKAHLNAYLDDYAFLIDAILSLLSYRWNPDWLHFAVDLADTLLTHFADNDNGGFYFTAHDHEKLIQRSKPLLDDALPAGNGVAAAVLLELGHLLGEPRYLEAAERTLKTAWPSIVRYPSAHNTLLHALEDYLRPPRQVIIRAGTAELETWRRQAQSLAPPLTRIYPIPADAIALPGMLNDRRAGNAPVAYICAGHQCLAPVTRLDLLSENLKNS
jgi:hypothetical protein